MFLLRRKIAAGYVALSAKAVEVLSGYLETFPNMTNTLLHKAKRLLQEEGTVALLKETARYCLPRRSSALPLLKEKLRGKTGVEIGGPSSIFARRGALPLYSVASRIDSINFASTTLWSADSDNLSGFSHYPSLGKGNRYIGEAVSLDPLVGKSYDFILSSHVLEHCANPIAALLRWKAVLRVSGMLVLVLPHRDATFDHRRPVTTLDHLVDDYLQKTSEDDDTHFEEVLRLHDRGLDPGIASEESFTERVSRNLENRGLHHHVFDGMLVAKILDYCGFTIVEMECLEPCHVIAIASTGCDAESNASFVNTGASYLTQSPFPTDRALPED